MLLPGRIELTTLGDLMGALHRERVSGALELVEPSGVTHRIHFRAGVVSGVHTPLCRVPLGRFLAEMGALSPSAQRALELFAVAASGRRVGAQLVDAAYLAPETLARALRLQLQQRLDAVARVERARVLFRPALRASSEAVPLSPAEFLHGRPRKRAAAGPAAGARAPQVPGRVEALRVLGLPVDADLAQIRAAFRRLAAHMHPDRQCTSSDANRKEMAERFARASAAYHLLVA